MRDIDVRNAVHNSILKKYHSCANSIVLDEFSLNSGAARVDITVINDHLHGYELKSQKDNLSRLPSQIEHYSSVLDKVTLVVDESHLNEAIEIIPIWWGVKTVYEGGHGKLVIKSFRNGKYNPSVNALALVKLLWKGECLELLEKLNVAKGNKNKPRFELWEIICENASLQFIKREVRQCLKARGNWRSMV